MKKIKEVSMWSLEFFKEFAKVPRPPYHEQRAYEYLKNYALSQGYEVQGDAAGNMIVRVAGAGSGVNRELLAIQAHTDMVCVSEPGREIDFLKDSIELYEEEGFLRARGTTLGADDGIGVALAFYCASLADHPPLEILLTVQEEVGMHGAAAVQAGFFKAKRMINIDNSDERTLIMGCAGGNTLELSLPCVHDVHFRAAVYVKVSVHGLTGGHSGMDIHLGRLAATKVLADVLNQLEELQVEYRLTDINIGMARNAIARDGYLELALASAQDKERVKNIKSRLVSADGECVALFLEEVQQAKYPALLSSTQQALLRLLNEVEHGVLSWANQARGEVKTSNNLATVAYDGVNITFITFHRSFDKADITEVRERIFKLANEVGASAKSLSEMAPWPPQEQGSLRYVMKEVYQELYPESNLSIGTVHAGLECGFWEVISPGIDMISMGPDNYDLHSPQERLDLASLARVERWLEIAMQRL